MFPKKMVPLRCLPTTGKNLWYEDSQSVNGTFFVLWCVTDFANPAVGFELRGGHRYSNSQDGNQEQKPKAMQMSCQEMLHGPYA